jgi:hypothetical protein
MKLSDLIRQIRNTKEHKLAIAEALKELPEHLAKNVQPLSYLSNQYYRAVAAALESIEHTESLKCDTLSKLADNQLGYGSMFEAEDGNTYTLQAPADDEMFTVKLLGQAVFKKMGGATKIKRIF